MSIAGCHLGERLLAVQFRAEKRTRAAAAALGSRLGAHGPICQEHTQTAVKQHRTGGAARAKAARARGLD